MKLPSPKTFRILTTALLLSAMILMALAPFAGAGHPHLIEGALGAWATIMLLTLTLVYLSLQPPPASPVPETKTAVQHQAKITLTIADVERGIEIRGAFEPPREPGKETPAQMLAIMAIDHIERQMSAAAFDANAKPIIRREGI